MMKLKAERLTKNLFFQPRMQFLLYPSPQPLPKPALDCLPHPLPASLFTCLCVYSESELLAQ